MINGALFAAGPDPKDISLQMGYCRQDLNGVPQGANLGMEYGNPGAIACLKESETVLDLGSSAGFDCFLACREVGPNGKVIGMDMTPEMVAKARINAGKTSLTMSNSCRGKRKRWILYQMRSRRLLNFRS